jgi:hypothetical protein
MGFHDLAMAAQVDLFNPTEIIMHFRSLYDLWNLLENGLDVEEWKFVLSLKAVGWGKDKINTFRLIASQTTRFELLIPSMKEGKR